MKIRLISSITKKIISTEGVTTTFDCSGDKKRIATYRVSIDCNEKVPRVTKVLTDARK